MQIPLTYDEILRIHKNAQRRYGGDQNLVSIGFGCARKAGSIDLKRGFSICLYVRKKKKRPSKAEKFDSVLTFRQKIAGKIQEVVLPTDVVECKVAKPTGRQTQVETPTSFRTATCGLQIRWSEKDGAITVDRTAFLTVGHVFDGVPLGQVVKLASASGDFKVFGRLHSVSSKNSGYDIGLVEVTDFSLAALTPISSSPVRLVTPDEVIAAIGKSGRILSGTAAKIFKYGILHPVYTDITGIPRVKNVVESIDAAQGTFQEGTSGAAWMIGPASKGEMACVQTAGFSDGHFKKGLGQLAFGLIGWISASVSGAKFISGSLKFEAVY